MIENSFPHEHVYRFNGGNPRCYAHGPNGEFCGYYKNEVFQYREFYGKKNDDGMFTITGVKEKE